MGMSVSRFSVLKVIDARPDENLLFVRGAVPGGVNGLLVVRKSKRVDLCRSLMWLIRKRKRWECRLPSEVFGCKPHAPLVHEAVVMQRPGRQGTASTLRRGE